jgi:putative FmdB family regulatory protein
VPVYEYACTECGEQLEVRQSFTDEALTVCPACEGRLRKVLSPVGVVFKGSGFYRTDSRASATADSKPAAVNGGTEKADSKTGTAVVGADKNSSGKSDSTKESTSAGPPGSQKGDPKTGSASRHTTGSGSTVGAH